MVLTVVTVYQSIILFDLTFSDQTHQTRLKNEGIKHPLWTSKAKLQTQIKPHRGLQNYHNKDALLTVL